MTTAGRSRVLQTGYAKGWTAPPEVNDHQLTHAVDVGFRVAMCGVLTTDQRGWWPADPTLWDSPLGRCQVCARVVYGTSDRRS